MSKLSACAYCEKLHKDEQYYYEKIDAYVCKECYEELTKKGK